MKWLLVSVGKNTRMLSGRVLFGNPQQQQTAANNKVLKKKKKSFI